MPWCSMLGCYICTMVLLWPPDRSDVIL